MEDLNEFKSFNHALANYFLAEQKMLYQNQVTILAHNKLIKSAQLLHATISRLHEIPAGLKAHLQDAITDGNISSILTISKQIQEILHILRIKYLSRS